VFEGLDLNAVVFLNGVEVGRHGNAHRPCRIEVTGKLQPGENVLSVRLESGLYGVADKPGSDYATAPETLLNKRHWLRKAQYQCGWDWNPRLINVGLVGDVRLEWSDQPWIEQLVVYPEFLGGGPEAVLHVRAFVVSPCSGPTDGRLVLVLPEAACDVESRVTIEPGESRLDSLAWIGRPRLWWPVGHGEQALYTIEAELEIEGQVVSSASRRTGIRRVRINQDSHPETGQYFIIEINDRPIFCKGGNWVPPDMVPASVEPERYRRLVELAVEANCNLLRVWGGGTYTPHALLEACDELGVLVWHDLLFACARYPADDPQFLAEVREEVTWAVRELAAHPSLVVWCGNNELEWGAWDWGYDKQGRCLPDYALFHHVLPAILKEEDPSRPYWPSSPYSPDHHHPNDPLLGDQHPWSVTLGEFGPDFWHYRDFVDRFPNEGGVLGASSPATLRQCLGEPFAFRSPAWEHHDNACNFWRPGPGITYQTVKLWLDREPEEMGLEDYCFASALLQAEGLCEYIGNYRRRMFSSSSAIFWMYNDSWPATHGWTIVDYYLRRKLAYHPVRRAFQPVTVVVAREGDDCVVFGVNDTPNKWTGRCRFGLFGLQGESGPEETMAATLPPLAAVPLGRVSVAEWERLGPSRFGAFAVLLEKRRAVAQHRLFIKRFHELEFGGPKIEVRLKGEEAIFTADQFAWGVCLDLDGELPLADNCFDLLPGVPYRVPWAEGLGAPRVVSVGNVLVVG
jgi:beta-mannosidase